MVKVNFYLNNSLIKAPKNWKELQIELNFDKDSKNSQVSLNDWNFVRENSDILNDFINKGITTGPGVFEGIPFKIEIERGSDIEKPFNGYLDLTQQPKISCENLTVKATERMNIDWLNDVADGFTYEYLQSIGSISPSNYVFVPYIINSIPDYAQAAFMTMTAFTILVQIGQQIDKLTELAIEMSNPFEATAIVRAVIYVAYLVLLIIALIKLIEDIMQLIIQPVKYHACMRVVDLLTIGAAHLGLTFKSTIFETEPFSKLVIMPEKLRNQTNSNDSRILGFTSPSTSDQFGYFKGTFGDLLRHVKTMFRGKYIINSANELHFVREDENIGISSYQLPDIYQPFYTLNTNEFNANYFLKFETDLIDKNTIQEYTGTSYQTIIVPSRVVNADLKLMKGLERIDIPFALAKRKTDFTVPEKIIKDLLDVLDGLLGALVDGVNALINVYNDIVDLINKIIKKLDAVGIKINFELDPINPIQKPDFSSIIENRIGMMKIETDFTNVPKIFLLQEGSAPKYNKIPTDNDSTVSAKYLWNNFHYVASFLPMTDRPNGNQYLIKEFDKVPFTFNDFVSVKNNNIIKDAEGNDCIIDSVKWNIWNETASIRWRQSKLYTNNFILTPIEPDGK